MSDTEKEVDTHTENVQTNENDDFDLSDVSEGELNDLKDGQDNDEDQILDASDLSKIRAKKRSTTVESNNDGDASERNVKRRAFTNEPLGGENAPEAIYSEESHDSSAKRREELEARLDRALKKPKIKRRKDEHDLTNDDDELIQILKQQMDTAAKKDAELIEEKKGIAINKIQLLPKVRDILSKVNLAEVILDNNLLAEIRQWLEPLPDASLPSYEIQKTLFGALLKLPINTNHLRESGIGKILLFYQKSKRVEPKIKRVADKLISDWTRPIIGASDNYRDKQVNLIDFDTSALRKIRANRASASSAKKEEKSIYEEQAARRNRAAAPAATVSDYKFAPKSRVDRHSISIASAGVGSSLNRDDQFKRINSKLSGSRRTATKKKGVSIEGRGAGI